MRLAPGTRLGPYEIVALLGAGGMGEVYRARDTRLESSPRWRRDGQELYYFTPDRAIVAVPVTPAKPFIAAPVALFRRPDLVRGVYDVSPDGTRFLLAIAVVAEQDLPLTLALGWRQELELR